MCNVGILHTVAFFKYVPHHACTSDYMIMTKQPIANHVMHDSIAFYSL